MKKILNITLLLAALTVGEFSPVFAQSGSTTWKKFRHDIGVGYGYNSLFAALGEDDKIGLNSVLQRSTFTASYRFFLLRRLALKTNLTHAYARKNDKKENLELRQNIPMDYQSSLSEFALLAEYHLIPESIAGKQGKVRRARGGTSKRFSLGLSVFGGIAVDYLRPYGEYFGQQVVLRPVNSNPGFDPVVSDYNRVNIHFPVGATFRYVINQNWRVGLEAGYRIGIRDYIDNVSAVYYRDGSEAAEPTGFPDESFSGGYVTFEKEQAPVSTLASKKGRRSYFMGQLVLSYTLKTK